VVIVFFVSVDDLQKWLYKTNDVKANWVMKYFTQTQRFRTSVKHCARNLAMSEGASPYLDERRWEIPCSR